MHNKDKVNCARPSLFAAVFVPIKKKSIPNPDNQEGNKLNESKKKFKEEIKKFKPQKKQKKTRELIPGQEPNRLVGQVLSSTNCAEVIPSLRWIK